MFPCGSDSISSFFLFSRAGIAVAASERRARPGASVARESLQDVGHIDVALEKVYDWFFACHLAVVVVLCVT